MLRRIAFVIIGLCAAITTRSQAADPPRPGYQPSVKVSAETRLDWIFAVANQSAKQAPKGWIDLQNAFAYSGLRGATSAKTLSFVPPVNQQALQMDDFAQCVLQNKPSRVPAEMGLRDMKIIAAIYQSAANGGKRVLVAA